MAKLLIENNTLVDTDLLDKIELRDKRGKDDATALGYAASILITGESKILYRYYTEGPGKDQIVHMAPKAG